MILSRNSTGRRERIVGKEEEGVSPGNETSQEEARWPAVLWYRSRTDPTPNPYGYSALLEGARRLCETFRQEKDQAFSQAKNKGGATASDKDGQADPNTPDAAKQSPKPGSPS